MHHRFLAEWCVSDGPADMEYFDPDKCEYAAEAFETYKEADRAAIVGAAKGPADDWYRVTEQIWSPNYYERGVGDWDDVTTWVSGEKISHD